MTEETDGGRVDRPVGRIVCMFTGHRYRVLRKLNQGARKVCCDRCGAMWGMHDNTRSFVPWDDDLETTYAPGGPLDPAHYNG